MVVEARVGKQYWVRRMHWQALMSTMMQIRMAVQLVTLASIVQAAAGGRASPRKTRMDAEAS